MHVFSLFYARTHLWSVMIKLRCFSFFLFMSAWLLSIQVSAQHYRFDLSGPIRAEIVRVIDGDTIEVKAKIWIG